MLVNIEVEYGAVEITEDDIRNQYDKCLENEEFYGEGGFSLSDILDSIINGINYDLGDIKNERKNLTACITISTDEWERYEDTNGMDVEEMINIFKN